MDGKMNGMDGNVDPCLEIQMDSEWMDGMDEWTDGSVYVWYVKNEWLDG